VTSDERAAPLSGSAEGLRLGQFARHTVAVAQAELRKVLRDPTEVFSRWVQPTLWLLVFGQVFGRIRAIPTGSLSYLDFITPGVLSQSVLFTAIFYGIAIIWEKDLGILQKLLVSPAYRGALVLGKAVTAGARALVQTVIIYLVVVLLGVRLQFTPVSIVGVLSMVLLGAAVFATFSLIVACLVKTRERFMGIGQVLTMPLFFASNAIYPIEIMPGWLRVVSKLNPLSYLVDVLRTLMVQGGHSAFGVPVDVGVELGALILLVAVAARVYPSVLV